MPALSPLEPYSVVETLPGPGVSLRTLAWTSRHAAASGQRDLMTASPVIVLLHGLGDTADVWRSMMASWSAPALVLAFDLPGHGRSPPLAPEAYCVSQLADHVARALAEYGINHPVLIGHSLGARICVELAMRPATRALGTVLVDMGVGSSDSVGTAIADHIDAIAAGSASIRGLIDVFRERLPLADIEALEAVVPDMATATAECWRVPLDLAIKRLLEAPADPNEIWRVLSRLSGPVGIVRGVYSAVLAGRTAERMAAVIPWQPVASHVIEMAGHAIPLEQPERLAHTTATCLTAWGIGRPDIGAG
jgi:pimeloyl-ACP methyl ester carboxylesterase